MDIRLIAEAIAREKSSDEYVSKAERKVAAREIGEVESREGEEGERTARKALEIRKIEERAIILIKDRKIAQRKTGERENRESQDRKREAGS